MGRRSLDPTGVRLAVATLGLVAVGALAGAAKPPAPAPPEIECGGYTADGDLLRPAAASVTHADRVGDGRLAVPATCGGYTEDGTFVGDD